jgi:hypothetical protein
MVRKKERERERESEREIITPQSIQPTTERENGTPKNLNQKL